MEDKDLLTAFECYRILTALKPDSAHVWRTCGELSLALVSSRPACVYAMEAIKLEPKNPEV